MERQAHPHRHWKTTVYREPAPTTAPVAVVVTTMQGKCYDEKRFNSTELLNICDLPTIAMRTAMKTRNAQDLIKKTVLTGALRLYPSAVKRCDKAKPQRRLPGERKREIYRASQ